MSTEGLHQRLPASDNYWSNFFGGSKVFKRYEGYMRMAEAYGVSEEKFIKKMEEFIREEMGSGVSDEGDPHERVLNGLIAMYDGDKRLAHEVYEFAKFKESQK